jgi:hypothetical protein
MNKYINTALFVWICFQPLAEQTFFNFNIPLKPDCDDCCTCPVNGLYGALTTPGMDYQVPMVRNLETYDGFGTFKFEISLGDGYPPLSYVSQNPTEPPAGYATPAGY